MHKLDLHIGNPEVSANLRTHHKHPSIDRSEQPAGKRCRSEFAEVRDGPAMLPFLGPPLLHACCTCGKPVCCHAVRPAPLRVLICILLNVMVHAYNTLTHRSPLPMQSTAFRTMTLHLQNHPQNLCYKSQALRV